ncbi:caiD, partial [Symbiodinium microadriaticum]
GRLRPEALGDSKIPALSMSSWQQAVALDLAKGKKRKDSLVVLNGNQQKNLRTGRDECDMAEWICDNCDTAMPGFYTRCSKCEVLRPEQRATRRELRAKEGEIGRGGGWKELQSQDDRREWNSDGEEYDDFGRKKKKRRAGDATPKAAAQSSKGDRQQAALERLRKGRKDD